MSLRNSFGKFLALTSFKLSAFYFDLLLACLLARYHFLCILEMLNNAWLSNGKKKKECYRRHKMSEERVSKSYRVKIRRRRRSKTTKLGILKWNCAIYFRAITQAHINGKANYQQNTIMMRMWISKFVTSSSSSTSSRRTTTRTRTTANTTTIDLNWLVFIGVRNILPTQKDHSQSQWFFFCCFVHVIIIKTFKAHRTFQHFRKVSEYLTCYVYKMWFSVLELVFLFE